MFPAQIRAPSEITSGNASMKGTMPSSTKERPPPVYALTCQSCQSYENFDWSTTCRLECREPGGTISAETQSSGTAAHHGVGTKRGCAWNTASNL